MQRPDIGHQLQPAPVHDAHDVLPNDAQFCDTANGSRSSASSRSCIVNEDFRLVGVMSHHHGGGASQQQHDVDASVIF